MFKPYSRPFDPTGKSLQNLIIAEHRPLLDDASYIFIPSHGPYYTDSLSVTAMGKTLERDKDYQCIILHTQATVETGLETAVAIKIDNTKASEVWISYQAIGGKYQRLTGLIEVLRTNSGAKVLSPIRWSDIVGKPLQFNPAAHYHPVWEFDGWERLIPSIKKIYQAIIARKHYKYEELLNYADVTLLGLGDSLESGLQELRASINDAFRKITPPVGTFLFSDRNLRLTDGLWELYPKETLLFAVSKDSDVGREYNVSLDMVPPFPDNVLLDEENNFILRNDEQFIFLDNEHETKLKVSDYWEEVDEQFDATTLRLYLKQTHLRVKEFPLPIFDKQYRVGKYEWSIQTQGLETGLKIPYEIIGVREEHTVTPLTGEWVVDENGVVKMSIEFIDNVLPQINKFFKFKIGFLDGISTEEIPYSIPSSNIHEAITEWTSGIASTFNDGEFYPDSSIVLRVTTDDYSKASKVKLKLKAVKAPGNKYKVLEANKTYSEHTVDELVPVDANPNGLSVFQFSVNEAGILKFELYNSNDVKVGETEELEIRPIDVHVDIVDALSLTEISEIQQGVAFKVRVRQQRDRLMLSYQIKFDNSEASRLLENTDVLDIHMGMSKTGYSSRFVVGTFKELNDFITFSVQHPNDTIEPIILKYPVVPKRG